ncbi:cysteine desulfurase family protein [Ferviditalea candida]|uniref:cysteine desulfurase n=1 Tax=Ferviditalea candida TaxID=3108399 RepID=A0ABU5ZHP5_9BACL|nr:cysteine desulfurase family protein [Paenibacillaceae bacterium T2]
MTPSIYLDHAATTPLQPAVFEAMLPYLNGHFGNPSSIHAYGRAARKALNDARDLIANELGCQPGQLVFTSGGTESDNLALFGVSNAYGKDKKHLITTQVEHHAVLNACRRLEELGYEVTYLPVDGSGVVSLTELEAAVRPETFLISVMYGNNEVGTIQPISEIGRFARKQGILFHVDAVQALGSEEIDLSDLPVDLMTFSAHKINGPKGVGALYVSPHVRLSPVLFGGNQERKRRAGTENVAGIVGFSKAVQFAKENLSEKRQQMERLRQRFLLTLQSCLNPESGFIVNGNSDRRLPHILNVSFPGTDTETLLMNFDLEGIAASSGSACTSGSFELSHVLEAMNLSPEIAHSAVRFSFGWGNTEEEIHRAAEIAATIVNRLRK